MLTVWKVASGYGVGMSQVVTVAVELDMPAARAPAAIMPAAARYKAGFFMMMAPHLHPAGGRA